MENKDKHLLHSINKPRVATSLSTPIVIVIIIVALALGAATGFGIYHFSSKSSTTTANSSDNTSKDGSKTSAGILDEKTFPDTAEGTLQEGGFEGEGSFHLERPGGEDQKAYLTSSTVDLSEFIGKKVRVRGQTFTSEKAGWLMDVGYIEIIE
ncbi:MAG TPA: hypothetical protein PLS49_04335 [Candidatus Woesebacteria bacterium]|nr:hypothetical protein [Candidatus Woesebacteria bacterium]